MVGGREGNPSYGGRERRESKLWWEGEEVIQVMLEGRGGNPSYAGRERR